MAVEFDDKSSTPSGDGFLQGNPGYPAKEDGDLTRKDARAADEFSSFVAARVAARRKAFLTPTPEEQDAWIHRSAKMRCRTCMYAVEKQSALGVESNGLGRCRRHAPTMQGFPAVFMDQDWCGDHKLDENKL